MSDARYSKDHEWARLEGDVAVCGVSDHAQNQLGDVVFVELPEVGARVVQFKQAAVVESVKAANEVYAPLSGEVVEVNAALNDDPSLVNAGAEAGGWFFKLKPDDVGELDNLMDAAAYESYLAENA